jgi:hypothetical protein
MDDDVKIQRVYDKLDDFKNAVNSKLESVAVTLSRMETTMESHLKEHEKNSDRGWQVVLKFMTPASVAAAVAYLIGQT